LLKEGRVEYDGPVGAAVRTYLQGLEQAQQVDLAARTDRRGWQHVRLEELAATNPGGGVLTAGEPARFEFHLAQVGELSNRPSVSVACTVHDGLGNPVAMFDSAVGAEGDDSVAADSRVACELDQLLLVPGRYRLDTIVRADGHLQDEMQGAAWVDVAPGLVGGRPVTGNAPGPVTMPHRWRSG
jgi:lipopolysaccharide transport system ATP-binding protein